MSADLSKLAGRAVDLIGDTVTIPEQATDAEVLDLALSCLDWRTKERDDYRERLEVVRRRAERAEAHAA